MHYKGYEVEVSVLRTNLAPRLKRRMPFIVAIEEYLLE